MSLTQKEKGHRTEVSISPENVRLPGGTCYDKEALARFRIILIDLGEIFNSNL